MEKIENLIVKYLSNSITREEWHELNEWIKNSYDGKLFSEYIRINYAIDNIMGEFNTDRTKNTILKKIQKDKSSKKRKKIKTVFRYAAVLIIMVSLGMVYQQYFSAKSSVNEMLEIGNRITLELGDGSLQVFENDKTREIFNTNGELIGVYIDNRLVYEKSSNLSVDQGENLLTVPYGKRFEIELSDGTIAFLNAGSTLKYPVKFETGKSRGLNLRGEAFFEVTKDSLRPFIVNTSNSFNVKVLGTKFNVSNYTEDLTTDVVLIEGSVELESSNEQVILEPGFKGSYDWKEGGILTKPVITKAYTSWMQGELVFRNVTFENIIKKLERHYDVSIINHNLKFAQKEFNANFGNEPIEVVLNYFKNTYGINYTINQNKITLK